MDREEVLATVIKHIRENVDGLEDVEIDPASSMAEYDASSLDIVEIVSASMRELQIRVPRTELVKCQNINDLVDLFDQARRGGGADADAG